MNFLRNLGVLLALTGIACAGMTATKAGATSPPYSAYTILDKPHKTDIIPNGINSSGQIVGSYTDSNFLQHGFLLYHGAYTKLDVPGAAPGSTLPAGINEFGVIVGFYMDGVTYGTRGFVLYHGAYTTFDVTLANAVPETTFAEGINDWGQVVGSYLDIDGTTRGFVLSNGAYTSFDVHSADPTIHVNATLPAGINDLGQITGQYTTDINGDFTTAATHGFVLSCGNVTTLDVPGAVNDSEGAGTQATGINVLGQVVGSFTDAAGTHGFVWNCGTYTTLNAPSAANTYANGINVLGQIVGYYDDGTFSGANLHGFVLNPW